LRAIATRELQVSRRSPNYRNTTANLPPELQTFAQLLNTQPPKAQEAFQFLLATAMYEAGKQARCSAWCGQELDYSPPTSPMSLFVWLCRLTYDLPSGEATCVDCTGGFFVAKGPGL
jgi:hypothetical protein